MELSTLHQLLIKSSAYRDWKKRNSSKAQKYEAFVSAVLRGENPTPPFLNEAFGDFLIGYASAYLSVSETPEAEPTPTVGLSYPKDPMNLFSRDGGLQPVEIASGRGMELQGWRCELKSAGLSRVHWSASRKVGAAFRIGATVTFGDAFRGVIMRFENYNDQNTNLHQLELARFRDGLWYVVQGLYKSTFLSTDQYNILFGGLVIPQYATVELRGKLSNVHGEALTELLINGVVVGTSDRANWATSVEQIQRQRFGVVEGDNSGATVVEIFNPYFV
jgi:hypothetical protein